KLQELFPGLFCSYKRDCHPFPPPRAAVVCFHGYPKPDETSEPWVVETWSEKELAGTTLELLRNTHVAVIDANQRASLRLVGHGVERLRSRLSKNGRVLIVGGGPSMVRELALIAHLHSRPGTELWALNGAGGWLEAQGLLVDALVVIDARPENLLFVQGAL